MVYHIHTATESFRTLVILSSPFFSDGFSHEKGSPLGAALALSRSKWSPLGSPSGHRPCTLGLPHSVCAWLRGTSMSRQGDCFTSNAMEEGIEGMYTQGPAGDRGKKTCVSIHSCGCLFTWTHSFWSWEPNALPSTSKGPTWSASFPQDRLKFCH